ncbi:hypothetical protein CDL15_Pgr012312 [Punica granatum]|uniref:Uncharacterized protein n=1 Tax=Punica granatum TaxID=22663 RepID=A0A218VX65_PUNGR|nr:hypothetical protein CDL15_Pgr012312 [Punica granatum]
MFSYKAVKERSNLAIKQARDRRWRLAWRPSGLSRQIEELSVRVGGAASNGRLGWNDNQDEQRRPECGGGASPEGGSFLSK